AVQTILTEGLNDPRLEGTLITVTEAHVDDGLSEAVLSVSVVPESKEDLALHGLRAAAGRIRREASDAIELKRAPRLVFRLDRSLKKQAAVLGALAKIVRERKDDTHTHMDAGDASADPNNSKGQQQP